MIRTLFIANRGEIARRIMRTARRLGMRCVLGVSATDRDYLPARMADSCVLLGTGPTAETYLHIARVVAAAQEAGADAVHPGYGFLSENAEFARAVVDAGMIFVGPTAETLDAVGDKLRARAVAVAAGLPVVPGGTAADADQARAQAALTGYPLLIKAVSGGGGRGMKRVDQPAELNAQLALARAEAQAAFGDARVYVERLVASGRHIEVQVLGDGQHALHLGTRDCSIQRRYQKLVEEAPAGFLPPDVLSGLQDAAVRLAVALQYRGAGTVEFLVDVATHAFYFLEMNARIQVEHPVTEAISGIDLVEQQLLVADGQALGLRQADMMLNGHALEVRINAEDWRAGFRPTPGRIAAACWPAGPGIRVDTHIAQDEMVPPDYDSLLGKLIVHAADRPAAIAAMAAALQSLQISGVATTAPMHRLIMADPRFLAGAVDTNFFAGLAHD